MQEIWHFIQELVHPKSIIQYGGLGLLLFIVFAETGLFFGFFLPGDSLLFIAGLFCATGQFNQSIFIVVLGLITAAILGNFVGYFFGLKAGDILLKTKDNLFYKRRYLEMAHEFYDKRGSFAIILGRFAPIIRTFVPIFAGMVKMDWRKFAIYNIVGAIIWVSLFTLVGFLLGHTYPKLGDHLSLIVVLLIIISIAPVIVVFFKKQKPSAL
jgi:membrane-associated protein